MPHYRANVNHQHSECFHHFDNEEKMFTWISEEVGEEIKSFDDCENWTRRQRMAYIEVLELFDLKKFYDKRRNYVLKLRECADLAYSLQKVENERRGERLKHRYNFLFDDVNTFCGFHPEVWQGEI